MLEPSSSPRFAIIGGTGFYSPGGEAVGWQDVPADYGRGSVMVVPLVGRKVFFLARHGPNHTLAPHLVNYRANISALRKLGVRCVLASASVGSMNPSLRPGSFALLTQFLDFTHSRPSTFFGGSGLFESAPGSDQVGKVVHTDMTDPYCPQLRADLAAAADDLGIELAREATYVCTEGPRFETAAEIRMFRQLGADLVGMTNVPEVVLAREAGMCYAAVAMVANWAAGMGADHVSDPEIRQASSAMSEQLRRLFERAMALHCDQPCACCGPREAG